MMPLADAALAVFVAWNSFVSGALGATTAQSEASLDSLNPVRESLVTYQPSGLAYVLHADTIAPADTIRKPRRKAIVYSDAYGTRLTVHRRLSWAMLPLFAVSYFSGDQILKKSNAAPAWARKVHAPAATGSAILFTANTITGTWNLWEGRHDANGRTRRIVHGLLFSAASGGFVYAGTKLANDAEQSQSKRLQHRNVALASMGVSTLSWLIMLIGN